MSQITLYNIVVLRDGGIICYNSLKKNFLNGTNIYTYDLVKKK